MDAKHRKLYLVGLIATFTHVKTGIFCQLISLRIDEQWMNQQQPR